MKTEMELLAQVWVGDDMGGMERAVVAVERSGRDEVRIGITEGDETIHVYLSPNRAVQLAQALIFQASKEWRL